FVYDGTGRMIGRYNSTVTYEEHVYLGGLPLALLEPGGPYYVAPDHLGSPHQVTNGAGQVVWFWDHGAFGPAQPTGALVSFKDRFPGQFYDLETGLHYNGARDYDPTLGRYIESDPIGLAGGINTYAYAGSNPVSLTDPSGRFLPLLLGVAGIPNPPSKFRELNSPLVGAGARELCEFRRLLEAQLVFPWLRHDGLLDFS
ncbi:MAG TPA: RHS repeat-associated core domain-containing protein, partial [Methylocystis sp.]|nr:RHS repeat-associated core domain-containing protein [Methylocystis sp.]